MAFERARIEQTTSPSNDDSGVGHSGKAGITNRVSVTHNGSDHRVRTIDLPFQNHAQAGLRVHRIVITRL